MAGAKLGKSVKSFLGPNLSLGRDAEAHCSEVKKQMLLLFLFRGRAGKGSAVFLPQESVISKVCSQQLGSLQVKSS